MAFLYAWSLVLIVLNFCTCGGKTECVDIPKVAVITNLQSKKCFNLNNHLHLQNVNDDLSLKYNFEHEDWRVEILFLDDCGIKEESLKAIFKSIIWADINCLKPPSFLGLIGPDKMDNLIVSQKVTSALEIPHIISIDSKTSNTHQITESSSNLIVKGLLNLIDTFGWKSFFLQSNLENKVIRKIARLFTMEASARKYCLLTNKDGASKYIFIGTPDPVILANVRNSSIIIIDDENLDQALNNQNSNNTLLVLDNLNTNLENTNSEYGSWLKKNIPTLTDSNELLLVPDATKIYIKALKSLCKSKSCNNIQNLKQWNQVVSSTVAVYNKDNESEKQVLTFKVKEKFGPIKSGGKISYENSNTQIYWNNQLLRPTKEITASSDLKNFFIISEIEGDCAQNIPNVNKVNLNENSLGEDKTATVVISDEYEWWTMVSTVAGVGIAMFAVGIFAVYIVYTNIRGPRSTKDGGRDLDRDSSLRRVGSDRQPSNVGRSSRVIGGLQRRDSRSSIRSVVSDKSV